MFCGFFLDPMPELLGHGLARLLEDVADQPDGARHHAQALHDLPVEPELAGERADRAGGVQSDVFLSGDGFYELAVLAVMPGLARDLEQAHAARIDRLVDRVAESGHAPILG